jgi:hypothetical protein
MEKVKYNRHEYREEYLKSNEWKTLRELVLKIDCNCQCCRSRKANDVHHLVYRNIVDITIGDLIPVCRSCHEYIHQAIDDGWISQDSKRFNEIKNLTLNILDDEDYKLHRTWLTSKHHLSLKEIKDIKTLHGFIIRKISGMVKRKLWYDDLNDYKFTGRQILNIRNIIILAKQRKNRKVDKFYGNRDGIVLSNFKQEKNVSLKDMAGFKSRKSIKGD